LPSEINPFSKRLFGDANLWRGLNSNGVRDREAYFAPLEGVGEGEDRIKFLWLAVIFRAFAEHTEPNKCLIEKSKNIYLPAPKFCGGCEEGGGLREHHEQFSRLIVKSPKQWAILGGYSSPKVRTELNAREPQPYFTGELVTGWSEW